MIRIYFLFILLFFFFNTFSQVRPALPYIDKDAPEYIKMLVLENPNVNEVVNAYTDYYETHPFVKNTYSQYYKKFMQWVRKYVQSDGTIYIPGDRELNLKEQSIINGRSSGSRSGNWTFKGPLSTYDLDGTTKVTWQTNIYCIDVAETNPDILFAGGETGGMWKTTDKGINWTLLTRDLFHGSFTSVKIDPSNSSIVFAGTGGKIIKTTDQGLSWNTIYTETNLNVNEIAISNTNNQIILAASNKGMLRSVNGGTSWTKMYSNETWTIKKSTGNGTTFYAVRDNGTSSQFVKSTDSGNTWTVSNTGWWVPASGESMTGAILATCPTNSEKIYAYLIGSGSNLYGYAGVWVSTNEGISWTNTNPVGAIGNSPLPYAVPGHTNLMANNGTTGFDQGFYDMAIVVNPNNDQQLIAGGTSWFKSTDGGATWSSLGGYVGNLPWSHPDIQWLVAIGNDLWIASDGGINYSTDFGNSHSTRMDGITGSDMWGFDSGWNEDILVGGRYHNGNLTYHQSFPEGKVYRMGGAEAATGYVNPGPDRRVYHSDIGGHKVIPGFGNGVTSFSVGAWPNESYAYYSNSDMVFHPNYYNTVFIGKDNKLMKSTDGGANYNEVHTFYNDISYKVLDFEISRSNPDVIYAAVWNGTDDIIWKTSDGGISWTTTSQLPLPNNNDRAKIAVSGENSDIVWVAVTYGSNGKKVYKTTDGGANWTNLTTALLDNIRVTNIMAQYGTDGGVYIGTDAGVFYRNNTHNEWQSFSTGLALSAETNKLKPFYKEDKIRNGCWGFGIWESPLFESSAIQAMPMVGSKVHQCTRDTVYFDDHSVLNHSGATWTWSFPGASYISSISVRNPKVLYNIPGTYDVSLTITSGSGTSTRTITEMITVEDLCGHDTIPGKAIYCSGPDKHGIVPDFSLPATNTLTVTAWVKPVGIQPDYSAIWMNENGSAGGINFREGNNTLGYHWPNGAWWWDSNLIPVQDIWNFVAMVVNPGSVTIYCNEKSATHNFSATPLAISGFRVGNYKGWGDRNTNAYIDELAVYNRSMSADEIRELRHLIKIPSDDPSLKAYFQFNGSTPNLEYNKAGLSHLQLLNGASRETSKVPVGKGSSELLNITSGGEKDFSGTGVKMYFPSSGPYADGDVVVSRIDQLPQEHPDGIYLPSCYWIINNYGNNRVFRMLDSILLFNSGNIAGACNPEDYYMYKRGANSQDNEWGNPLDYGDLASLSENKVKFSVSNGIETDGQIVIIRNSTGNGDPDITELCNGLDDNCNGIIDEDPYLSVINGSNNGTGSLRSMIECAENGDTVFINTMDTIRLTDPLIINKNIVFIDEALPYCIILLDLSGSGFSDSNAGIIVPENSDTKVVSLTIEQKNNSETKPLFRISGNINFQDCTLKGNVNTKIITESPGEVMINGLTTIE
jgi:photosystem II stability/assembly factor-like uncharacterized protein